MSNRRFASWAIVCAGVAACTVTFTSAPMAAGLPVVGKDRPAAADGVVRHNPFGRFLGVVPTTTGPARRTTRAPNGTPPLVYHNGPVQHSSTVYAIFWSPPGTYLPVSYRDAVTQYFKDVASDRYRV